MAGEPIKRGEPATFEPVDKLAALKAEMASKFAGMDENLAKIKSSEQANAPPITNFQSRMKEAWKGFQDAAVAYQRLVPGGGNLLGGFGAIAVAFANEEKRQQKELGQVAREEQLSRQREASILRNEAAANVLNNWKPENGPIPVSPFPKGLAEQAAQTMAGNVPPTLAAQASSVLQSAPSLPGAAASTVSTPPYAAALASGGSDTGQSAGGSVGGGKELGEILSVLKELVGIAREIRDAVRDNDDDPSETVENRRPEFVDKEPKSMWTQQSSTTANIDVPGTPRREHLSEGIGRAISMIKTLADMGK